MISLSILAGGNSRRMGQDKGLMDFMGQPLILHVMDRLATMTDDAFIISNRPGDYAFTNMPVYADITPGLGPLGGIYTAMNKARHPLLAIAGCDMPFASLPLFQVEQRLMEEKDMDLVIPLSPEGLEPLHAVYRVSTCLPAIRSSIEAGNNKIIAWFSEVKTYILDLEVTTSHSPQYQAFMNLNTPEEALRAEKVYLENASRNGIQRKVGSDPG